MQIREISAELAKIAKEELNEDSNRIESDVKAIKEWISKSPHLHARTDDQWIISFLRGCKYSLERTKEKIDLFYTMRNVIPDMAMPIDPMEDWVQELLSLGTIIPLPKTNNPNDARVILVRPGAFDADKISMMSQMRVSSLSSLIHLIDDDQSVIVGQRYIIDLDKVTFTHFTQMTPSLIKKMVTMSQEAMPIRQKGSHHINTPPGSETIFNFFRTFMNEKNKSRIHMHNKDMEALYKFVPKSILPTELGGEAGPIQNMIDENKKKLESYREWILEDMQYKTDENKRKGSPKTSETFFGIEGSFRQLNID